MRIYTGVLALMLASGTASAETAGELLAHCEQLERSWVIQDKNVSIRANTTGSIDAGKCWGYLHAYFDIAYMNLIDADKPDAPPIRPLGACPPKGVSLVQFIRMFLQKARNTPAELHHEAFFMISNLLNESFPCPR